MNSFDTRGTGAAGAETYEIFWINAVRPVYIPRSILELRVPFNRWVESRLRQI